MDLGEKVKVQEERIKDLNKRITKRDEQIKQLQDEIKQLQDDYKNKQSFEASSDEYDDLQSEDTETALATELTIATQANNDMKDEIVTLRQDIAILRQNAQEEHDYHVYMEELLRNEINKLEDRTKRIHVLAKTALQMNIESPIDALNSRSCLICLDDPHTPFIRTNKCKEDHGICFKCFVQLLKDAENDRCPICMTHWEEGNLLIE